jgi:hypothetical protein
LPASDLCIDPIDGRILYATFGGGDSGGWWRVVRLLRVGIGYIVANDITNDLPSGLSVQAIAVHPRIQEWGGSALFVGTNKGVFQGVLKGTGNYLWTPYNNGLPLADVRRLLFLPTGLLRAGTFGRGAHEVFVGWAEN